MDTIGKRLKARRKQLGLTQRDLGLRAGVSQPTLSEIEADKTKEMEASTLAGLCRELMLTPEYLIFGVGEAGDEDIALKSSELLYILRSLSQDKQEALMGMARGLYSPPAPVRFPASDWDNQHPKH